MIYLLFLLATLHWVQHDIDRNSLDQKMAIPRFRNQISAILQKRASPDLRTYTRMLRDEFEEQASKRQVLPVGFLETGRESGKVCIKSLLVF